MTALFSSLQSDSIAENLAYYELHTGTPDGQKALMQAWKLLGDNQMIPLPGAALLMQEHPPKIPQTTHEVIHSIAKHLKNRSLKGFSVTSEEEVLLLPPEEVDLSKALFISLGEEDDNFESMLDLMALQVQARGGTTREINRLLFEEMGFRFPPQSQYAAEIDRYTNLGSVLQSRRGVCLGVSILYLCLAQRLGIPLEAVTPPGHIYVREPDGDNIEVTARGIHLPSEVYLTMNTHSLQTRNIKEVIALAHMNRASQHLKNKKYEKALTDYSKAEKYLPDDPHLKSLQAITTFIYTEKKPKPIPKPSHYVAADPLIEEIRSLQVQPEDLELLFEEAHSRPALHKRKVQLEKTLKRLPTFGTARLELASTHLALGDTKKALEELKKYPHTHPTSEWILCQLALASYDYPEAKKHLITLETLLPYESKTLKSLRRSLPDAF